MRLKWLNHSDLHEFLVQTTEAVSRKKLDPQRAYALACLVKLIEENLPKVDSELREHQRLGWAGMEPDEVESLAWRLQKEEKNIAKAMEEEEKGGAEEE
ncbi:MAG TPA: hypothetical protein VNN18_05875 [Candidatus Xenobia bacterium]|nr:hypothetical protein [Candidatus Xenobia bacterium]